MPSIGDVSVHVLDSHGIRHEEWGVQRLHISKDQAKISAYIKSESGMAFTISVEAKLPYRDHNTNEFVPSSSEDSNNIYKRQRMRGEQLSNVRQFDHADILLAESMTHAEDVQTVGRGLLRHATTIIIIPMTMMLSVRSQSLTVTRNTSRPQYPRAHFLRHLHPLIS